MMFDISPLISSELAVFPGDQPFLQSCSMAQADGDHLDLSSITTSVHIGSHADAPSHFGKNADTIDAVNLLRYMGRAQVIRVSLKPDERIFPHHFKETQISAPRILFATDSFPNPNIWNGNFNSLSPELIEWLHDKKVILVGIDTPSVDPAESKKLESHKALLKTGMSVLEGLVLSEVPQGIYTLIALPLKIAEAEASPVRAILLDENTELSRQ